MWKGLKWTVVDGSSAFYKFRTGRNMIKEERDEKIRDWVRDIFKFQEKGKRKRKRIEKITKKDFMKLSILFFLPCFLLFIQLYGNWNKEWPLVDRPPKHFIITFLHPNLTNYSATTSLSTPLSPMKLVSSTP